MAKGIGATCWKFADAQFDERALELTVGGAAVALERKPLEVLRLLLLQAGDVVSHDELLDAVWPGRIVSESVLKKCVSRLRDVLRDEDHTIVKTVHGYGYRLVSPVERLSARPTVVTSPQFRLSASAGTRTCAVLIVDIAGTVELRSKLGDAAGGRRIRYLLDTIIAITREHGGDFIKSYGDDVLATFERNPISSAAAVAVDSQRLAADAGLQLYAGFHFGEVEFHETQGHLDALGLTVNFAARLHKLTEGAPGRIFLTEDSVSALTPELRTLASRYGVRELKGIGSVSVWTLDWRLLGATKATVLNVASHDVSHLAVLLLCTEGNEIRMTADGGLRFVGRGNDCLLRVDDPEARISSKHLLFEHSGGRWFVQDISRNGTWLRDVRSGEISLLPYCARTLLPQSGALCLGRSFADDPEGSYAVSFELCGD